jgi:hypothetical protein
MKKRILINIFLFSSLIILIWVLVRIGAAGKIINIVTERIKSDENISEDYPEYIYETFVDGNGDEVSVKMEKKTGTLDGEEVVFYEDTIGSEVIFYNFYKGFIEDVDSEKIVFVVKEDCLNADPEASFYEYRKVEEYKLVFYLDDYFDEAINGLIENTVFINTKPLNGYSELVSFIGKDIRLQNSKFKDWLTKSEYICLDLYIN